MENFWDKRYEQVEYAYGKDPNEFFREVMDQLPQSGGKILFPAEGEGRNAVYAAKKGWTVFAFDISTKGRDKAMKLADEAGVTIDYRVGKLSDMNYEPESFDAVVLIFAHFPPSDEQDRLYQEFGELVKQNGYIIIEGFSENNLKLRAQNRGIGGPGSLDMLFSKEKMQRFLPTFSSTLLEEKEVYLNEGEYHNGISSVIRFIGRKK